MKNSQFLVNVWNICFSTCFIIVHPQTTKTTNDPLKVCDSGLFITQILLLTLSIIFKVYISETFIIRCKWGELGPLRKSYSQSLANEVSSRQHTYSEPPSINGILKWEKCPNQRQQYTPGRRTIEYKGIRRKS
jgi:hypothetical protein